MEKKREDIPEEEVEQKDPEVSEEGVEEEKPEEAEPKVDFEAEAERWKDRCARLQADFTNYKRRSENEKKEYIGLGVKKLAGDLLPVVDNLERAVEAGDEDNPYLAGVKLIEKQIKEILEKHDIKPMEAMDQPFDPNFHHAVMVEEAEGKESGVVIDVMQKGYIIGDTVLRPAMVKVSQ